MPVPFGYMFYDKTEIDSESNEVTVENSLYPVRGLVDCCSGSVVPGCSRHETFVTRARAREKRGGL